MSFGETIKKLRLERKLTQKDVANALKCGYTIIGDYERGNRKPSHEKLIELADFFGVSIDYLTTGKENTSDELEKTFVNGIKMLRRANNELDEEGKEKLVQYIEFILEQEKKRKKDVNK
jgi:transcriptional regulator with XRE-family HTH domain